MVSVEIGETQDDYSGGEVVRAFQGDGDYDRAGIRTMRHIKRRYEDAIASCELVTGRLAEINRSLSARPTPSRDGICPQVRQEVSNATEKFRRAQSQQSISALST